MSSYVIWTVVVAPIIGLLVHVVRTRFEIRAKTPLQLLQDQLAKREAELIEIRAQDRRERDEYLQALGAIQATMEEMAKDMRSLREEERAGRAKVHERLDTVEKDLTVIKTRLEPGA